MKLEEIQIRETSVNDFADIMEVEKTAFGYDKEAELVADLLKDPSAEPRLSLLARYNGKAVGIYCLQRQRLRERQFSHSSISLLHWL